MLALASGWKQREARHSCVLPSVMRDGPDWVDACIHNISDHGLLVCSDRPAGPGAYVEIRHGAQIIIGRAVWRKDRFFGVTTQDRLDIPAILSAGARAPRAKAKGRSAAAAFDGQGHDRLLAEAKLARRIERSRRFSASFQFGLLLAMGLALSAVAAVEVHGVLERPFAAIRATLSPEG